MFISGFIYLFSLINIIYGQLCKWALKGKLKFYCNTLQKSSWNWVTKELALLLKFAKQILNKPIFEICGPVPSVPAELEFYLHLQTADPDSFWDQKI